MKVHSELVQDRRAWSVSICDVVNSIDDAGPTHPSECRHKYKQVSRVLHCFHELKLMVNVLVNAHEMIPCRSSYYS